MKITFNFQSSYAHLTFRIDYRNATPTYYNNPTRSKTWHRLIPLLNIVILCSSVIWVRFYWTPLQHSGWNSIIPRGVVGSFIYSGESLLGKGREADGDIKCWDGKTGTIVEKIGNQDMKEKSGKKIFHAITFSKLIFFNDF